MIFNSVDFGIFFPLVFFLYWLFFRNSILLRNVFLILVSYFFYGWWDWRFLSLIMISSAVDFYVGQKLSTVEEKRTRKKWLYLSVIVNLGFLGFFKYYNFFVDSFINSFSVIGVDFDPSRLNIILPVGISFYTFQTLSYTFDVYYKKIQATKDVFAFFAFVSFFPQLVAGPIERAKDLLPQFLKKQEIDYASLKSGLLLIAFGLFKKIVIADRLAIFVNGAYGDVGNLGGLASIFAVIFFAFQLYLDFSAYSDIAIGSARMLGFKLSTNFNRPYLSSSFSDFWKRWHISLSSWFKDYVYIPLGGNRGGKSKHIKNIIIVFALSGLWHGASWNFVIWGLLNGLFILVFDRFLRNKDNNLYKRVLTSLFISSLWALSLIFFRSQSLADTWQMFSNLFASNKHDIYNYGLGELEFVFTIKLLMAYMLFEIGLEKYDNIYIWFNKRNLFIRWAVYISLTAFIILFGSYGVGLNDNSFIYFQF